MNENIKNTLLQVQQLLNQNTVFYYASKIVRLIFEFICYLLALIIFTTGVALSTDPVKFHQELNETVSIISIIHIEYVSHLIILIKIILIILSITFVGIGLLLGSIRRKNTIIKTSMELINNILIKNT